LAAVKGGIIGHSQGALATARDQWPQPGVIGDIEGKSATARDHWLRSRILGHRPHAARPGQARPSEEKVLS